MVEPKRSFTKRRSNSGKPKNGNQLQQQVDKYINLAQDAASSGDRVAAERYYQHADHFYRVAMEKRDQQSSQNQPREATSNPA
jgi:hypothetical protein